MFFNAQPAEIPENAFPADEPSDFPHETPVEVPSEDPLGVPAQDPLDVPSDVPSNTGARAEGIVDGAVQAHPHRTAIAVTGAVLLSLLTATAVFAAKEGKDMDKVEKDKLEHGQKFENAHGDKDSIEAREHAAAHPGKPHMGPPGHPTPPGFEGPNGKPTFMNRKMRGHQHHADHPARTTADAKHWQDKRMWRQEGTWPGADSWANARAKYWKAERTTWPMRGGYGGAFITQAEYDKHYTVAHDFRLGDEPKMKNGYAHFSHEGDHFVIVDPYPENWNTKWHSSDDVYLEYNQGYYLINRQHPGSPVAVMVLE